MVRHFPGTDIANSRRRQAWFGELHNTLLRSAEPNRKAVPDLANVCELS